MTSAMKEIDIDIEAAEKIINIETEIHTLNEQHRKEQEALTLKYINLKTPIFSKRDEAAQNIPSFWSTTLINNSFMQSLALQPEFKAIEKLERISVERSGVRDIKLRFHFAENEFFKDRVLVKEVKFNEDGDVTVIPAKMTWNKGKKFYESKKCSADHDHEAHEDHGHVHEESGFFGWLEDNDSCSANIAMFISEELYAHAGSFYAGEGEGSEDEEEYEDMVDDE